MNNTLQRIVRKGENGYMELGNADDGQFGDLSMTNHGTQLYCISIVKNNMSNEHRISGKQ